MRYPYTIEPQEDGVFFVQFLDFKEGFTEGYSIKEAKENAQEVLEAILMYRLDEKQEIPLPTNVEGVDNIYHARLSSEVLTDIITQGGMVQPKDS